MSYKGFDKFGKNTALISFFIGSIIFLLYFLTSSLIFLIIGYGYFVLCLLFNLGVLAILLFKAISNKKNRSPILGSCGLMLINIPVLILYCWLAIELLGTVRITFKNDMGSLLSDIKIVGCGGGYIEELDVGESKTIWIEIPSDCSIHLEYAIDGEKIEEVVVGYTTGMIDIN